MATVLNIELALTGSVVPLVIDPDGLSTGMIVLRGLSLSTIDYTPSDVTTLISGGADITQPTCSAGEFLSNAAPSPFAAPGSVSRLLMRACLRRAADLMTLQASGP